MVGFCARAGSSGTVAAAAALPSTVRRVSRMIVSLFHCPGQIGLAVEAVKAKWFHSTHGLLLFGDMQPENAVDLGVIALSILGVAPEPSQQIGVQADRDGFLARPVE